MSQQALEYVASVPSGKLSPTERFVLRIIAEEFKDCHGSANFELKLLEEETRLSRRHLRRLLSGMPEILDYIPARGEGHYGQFKFPKLLARQLRVEKAPEGDIKKGTRRGQEGDARGAAIQGVEAIAAMRRLSETLFGIGQAENAPQMLPRTPKRGRRDCRSSLAPMMFWMT